LIMTPRNEPMTTDTVPKKGPNRNPIIGAPTKPSVRNPPPPIAKENGNTVSTSWTAAKIPVRAQGYAFDLMNSGI